jgi:hypothetical protein
MSTLQFQSMEDVYELQIEHLQSQYRHLKFMHEYHSWMMSELAEPMLGSLHGSIVEKVNEALKDLNQLIEVIQPASRAETGEAYSIKSTSD